MASSRLAKFSFLAGMLTVIGMCLPPLWFVERRLGLRHLWDDVAPFKSPDVDLPPRHLRAELTALGAVPDNLPDFTNSQQHRSFLVRPDDELDYVLQPNARGTGYLLRTRLDFNLNPPVLYLPFDSAMSQELIAYLQVATRVRHSFSTNAEGFRTTLPVVSSARRVLMIGDSVAFGLGVDDEATMASHLQRRVGEAFQIVNAGVGGYDADQILLAAARHTAARTFDAMIYVANLNDFEADSEQEMLRVASDLLRRLATLKARVGNRVVVLLHGDLEYAVRDIFDAGIHGWTGPWIAHADYLRARLPAVASELGFTFIDMPRLIDESVQAQGSVFSPFAFYVDHAHLSSHGNRVAADALLRTLATLGMASP